MKREERENVRDNGQWPRAAAFVGFRAASPHLGKCPANRINQPRTLRSAGSSAKTSANFFILRQAGRQVGTVGSGLRPLTDRKIRSKGLYFLILLVVRSVVVGVPVLFVRQLRQIFCVLIKHGLRRYLSPGTGQVGSGQAFAYSVPDLQPLPFCCQRIWQWALPVVLPRTVPRNMPRIALRYNINVVTLRSIFPP